MKHAMNRALALLLAISLLATSVFASDMTADSVEEFYQILLEQFQDRAEDFTIGYTVKGTAYEDSAFTVGVFQQMLLTIFDHDVPADYAALNLDNGAVSVDGDNNFTFHNVEYLDTPEEEAAVLERVDEILAELDLEGDDDIAKIKKIYEYMTTNFTYDKSLEIFSAYDGLLNGTMVCQGFSILTSRLLDGAGLNSRMVCGTSRDMNHAWNMVEWQGEWYLLDTTWDSTDEIGTPGAWTYFMKSETDFEGHEPFDQFTTEDFLERHPLATESYNFQYMGIAANGSQVGNLAVRLGVEVELSAVLPEGMEDDTLVWTFGDSDIITLEDGILVAQETGETWLSVESVENPQVIGDTISIVAVDMTALSFWAEDIVTDYYLAQMLPITLCGDFQDGITRAELAVLVDELAMNTRGYGSFTINNPFDDISHLDTDTQYAILRCFVAGMMTGIDENTFRPDTVLTREEAATVLVRAMAYLQEEDYAVQGETTFLDVDDIAFWAVEWVTSAQEQGLLQGDDNGYFSPKDTMTREQMIVACSRVYDQDQG